MQALFNLTCKGIEGKRILKLCNTQCHINISALFADLIGSCHLIYCLKNTTLILSNYWKIYVSWVPPKTKGLNVNF